VAGTLADEGGPDGVGRVVTAHAEASATGHTTAMSTTTRRSAARSSIAANILSPPT